MYEKTMANLAMIRARKGPIIAVATEGDEAIKKVADDVIYVPKTIEPLNPILTSVPLQLFAYHIAVARAATWTSRATSRKRHGAVKARPSVKTRAVKLRALRISDYG